MNTPTPPPRPPWYGDTELYGWPHRQCAINLLNTLAGWCNTPLEFKGDATGRIWNLLSDFADRAQLLFTSDRGDGRIELFVARNDWICAEVFLGEAFKLRAWIEAPYEEKEFWPDGSEGTPNIEGDAAGRISKRGRWLQIRCADFPSVPDNDTGYWTIEDTFD